jgi:hypothetical protein
MEHYWYFGCQKPKSEFSIMIIEEHQIYVDGNLLPLKNCDFIRFSWSKDLSKISVAKEKMISYYLKNIKVEYGHLYLIMNPSDQDEFSIVIHDEEIQQIAGHRNNEN